MDEWVSKNFEQVIQMLKDISKTLAEQGKDIDALKKLEEENGLGIKELEKQMVQVLAYLAPPPATSFKATITVTNKEKK